MSDKTGVTYLFDPLCGWCYGASGVLADLAGRPDVDVELVPTGLFAGPNAPAMDARFAAFAWSNDQRIARLTGRVFSDTYREQVLGQRGGRLDSGPATIALTAVALTEPSRELEALRLIQEARYVAGRDVTDMAVVIDILEQAGLAAAASRLAAPDDDLIAEVRRRIGTARTAMSRFGVDGVPALVVDDQPGGRLVKAGELLAGADSVIGAPVAATF